MTETTFTLVPRRAAAAVMTITTYAMATKSSAELLGSAARISDHAMLYKR
jgi:hypothetical protein